LVRTDQPSGRPRRASTTQRPTGLCAASASSTTAISSRIRVAERHDPIGHAETLVSAAFDRGQAVALLDLARDGVEVGDGDQT
jgi:hypothetical protein